MDKNRTIPEWIGDARHAARYAAVSLVASAVLVFTIEFIFRGDLAGTIAFFMQPFKPGWTTIALFVLILILDYFITRALMWFDELFPR